MSLKEYCQQKGIKYNPPENPIPNDIKKCFRKAAFLCHPDTSGSNSKTIFQKLNSAYQNNDLIQVQEILKLMLINPYNRQ